MRAIYGSTVCLIMSYVVNGVDVVSLHRSCDGCEKLLWSVSEEPTKGFIHRNVA